jgi:2-polyprenyl-6-methoxyphenol hydroxylase-like FAD-dependent oxidoreductase
VVVGGGPAGLAAALDVRSAGAGRVVVLERRSAHTRRRSVALDWEVLLLLSEWGLDLEAFNLVDTLTFIHGYGESRRAVQTPFRRERPHDPTAPNAVRPRPGDILFRRLQRGVEQIRNIERWMLEAARRRGIEVRFDAVVTSAPRSDERGVSATVDVAGLTEDWSADYLVVADGSRSVLNEALGNSRVPSGYSAHAYVCAVFQCRKRDMVLHLVARQPDGLEEITGMGNGELYTVVAQLPAGWKANGELTAREQQHLVALLERAARLIGVEGPMVEEPMPFVTHTDRLAEVAPHPRILCAGDANRRGDPGFGGNMSEAIRDGRRIGDFYRRVTAQPADAGAALEAFRRETQAATTALQAGGLMMNGWRASFALGSVAQRFLPGPLRSLLHFNIDLAVLATGGLIELFNPRQAR